MLTLTLMAALLADNPAPDVVIRGATIYDGTGAKPITGDVAIRGDRIVGIGKVADKAARTIDGSNLVVAPGFIDLHTHSDDPLRSASTRANKSYLHQGVTTVVTGNCGSGPVDVAAQFKALEKNGIGSNVIHLTPHNAVRSKIMKNVNRQPTKDELVQMQELVDKAMADGAWGMSTGLIYNPGTYSKTDELIALASVAGKHGGIYASHIRDEGAGLLDAIDEAIRIGREGKLPVHVSHIKSTGKSSRAADAVVLIDKARAEGLVVTADQYPYTASSTSLKAMVVPSKYREGTSEDFKARLDDPDTGPKLKADIAKAVAARDDGKALRVARYKPKPAWQGMSIAAIAEQEKTTPLDVVLEIERHDGAQMVSFGMKEEDVRMFMKQPWVATASDGSSKVPDESVPHPRSYGTFPRKVGKYAIDDQNVTLEHAIRSCTGLPAEILKLPERGILKEGYFADVVVFDPKTFRDTATYDKPHQFAPGVKFLFVNGKLAIDEGEMTKELAGRVLRHK